MLDFDSLITCHLGFGRPGALAEAWSFIPLPASSHGLNFAMVEMQSPPQAR
jgi:hypothetical protein